MSKHLLLIHIHLKKCYRSLTANIFTKYFIHIHLQTFLKLIFGCKNILQIFTKLIFSNKKIILTTHHKGLLSQGVQDGKGEGGRDRGGLLVPPGVFILEEDGDNNWEDDGVGGEEYDE